MKIYHYTSIDALAMILSTCSIKFNRLDWVDDLEESVESNNVHLGQYVFVSCWTEEKEESIPLWKMYSGSNHGIRIALDLTMFEDNVSRDITLPNGLQATNCYFAGITDANDPYKSYYVLPGITLNNKWFYSHVEYVHDIKEKTKDAYQLAVGKNNQANVNIAFGEVGKYKNERWQFQKESRFRLIILPVNISNCNSEEVGTLVLNAIHQSKPVPLKEYFLSLRQEVLDSIEVTLHPNSSDSDRIIVEALCSKYAKNAAICDSCLRGKVNIK